MLCRNVQCSGRPLGKRRAGLGGGLCLAGRQASLVWKIGGSSGAQDGAPDCAGRHRAPGRAVGPWSAGAPHPKI